MLIGVHPALTPDILHMLAMMGHGDSLVLVDANFPAASVAQATCRPTPVDWTVDAGQAIEALLTHFPIDTYDTDIPAVRGMAIVGNPDAIPEVVQDTSHHFATRGHQITLVERMAFYDLARTAFAVIRTAETRPYGNFMIRKGVVAPPA